MNKAKLVLIGLALGINLALAARYVYVEWLWTNKRPIVQEVHNSYLIQNGNNTTATQTVTPAIKQKSWFIGGGLGNKQGMVIAGHLF